MNQPKVLSKSLEQCYIYGISKSFENGFNFSGGQRQRLLLARALLHQPKILVLDEATSSLDSASEQLICDSLSHIQCTQIIIAHRLSTVRHADRIVVLDNGKIIEEGTH